MPLSLYYFLDRINRLIGIIASIFHASSVTVFLFLCTPYLVIQFYGICVQPTACFLHVIVDALLYTQFFLVYSPCVVVTNLGLCNCVVKLFN